MGTDMMEGDNPERGVVAQNRLDVELTLAATEVELPQDQVNAISRIVYGRGVTPKQIANEIRNTFQKEPSPSELMQGVRVWIEANGITISDDDAQKVICSLETKPE